MSWWPCWVKGQMSPGDGWRTIWYHWVWHGADLTLCWHMGVPVHPWGCCTCEVMVADTIACTACVTCICIEAVALHCCQPPTLWLFEGGEVAFRRNVLICMENMETLLGQCQPLPGPSCPTCPFGRGWGLIGLSMPAEEGSACWGCDPWASSLPLLQPARRALF